MKSLLLILGVVALAGCGKPPAEAVSPTSGTQTLPQKLQAMSPEERTAYAQAHPDEMRSMAGMPTLPPSNK